MYENCSASFAQQVEIALSLKDDEKGLWFLRASRATENPACRAAAILYVGSTISKSSDGDLVISYLSATSGFQGRLSSDAIDTIKSTIIKAGKIKDADLAAVIQQLNLQKIDMRHHFKNMYRRNTNWNRVTPDANAEFQIIVSRWIFGDKQSASDMLSELKSVSSAQSLLDYFSSIHDYNLPGRSAIYKEFINDNRSAEVNSMGGEGIVGSIAMDYIRMSQ